MRLAFLLCLMLSAAAQSPEALQQEGIVLARERDYAKLSKLLRDPKYLTGVGRHLGGVMAALSVNPTAEIAALCHTLANDKVFLADPDRMLPLLNILGAVKPMTRQTSDLFRSANEIGYFGPNAILLATNGSPVAMELFEAMILDSNHPIENRIEYLRFGIIPRRTSVPILLAAGNMLARTKEPRLAIGLIECLFDYRAEWFRPDNAPDAPPAWETASTQNLFKALELAAVALQRRDLPPALRQAIERESGLIRTALGRRG